MNTNELKFEWKNKDKILLEVKNSVPVYIDSIDEIPNCAVEKISTYGIKDSTNENLLIRSDNIYALKYLQKDFCGKIKCIYIDPPFNTGKNFDHYNDDIQHSVWLSMMKIRLEFMRDLLSDEGVIFVHIDDDEMPYLKLLMDEVFCNNSYEGADLNYISTIIWQKKFAPQNDAKFFSDVHDYILVYAKNVKHLKLNLIERSLEQNKRYVNKDNDPRGPWMSSDLTVKTPNPEWVYEITLPSGRVVVPSKSRSWGFSQKRFLELVADNRIWFGEDGDTMPRLKRFLSEVKNGVVPKTIWLRNEVGDNSEGKKEIKKFVSENTKVFTTPKPERLLERIIHIATNEGDWVLDAFLGSGTTCAVAHKMKRKWIGIELGNQIEEICIPRLKAVIDGTDKNGVSKSSKWKKGGSFSYYSIKKQ